MGKKSFDRLMLSPVIDLLQSILLFFSTPQSLKMDSNWKQSLLCRFQSINLLVSGSCRYLETTGTLAPNDNYLTQLYSNSLVCRHLRKTLFEFCYLLTSFRTRLTAKIYSSVTCIEIRLISALLKLCYYKATRAAYILLRTMKVLLFISIY